MIDSARVLGCCEKYVPSASQSFLFLSFHVADVMVHGVEIKCWGRRKRIGI